MNTTIHSLLGSVITATLITTLPALSAQSVTDGFKKEPDQSMAAAKESFEKGDKDKAAADLQRASRWVKKQADKVGQASSAGMKSAGTELEKLGDDVKSGSVKSGDEMKKTFAKVDHEIATCWHKTAEDSKNAGKDSTAALKKAGGALESSARWSGHQLSAGAKDSVKAVKKASKAAGEGTKATAEEVDKWFKGIGEGIKDLGKNL